MTNSELKQEILRVLSELVEHCPDVQFGQPHHQPLVHRQGADPRGGLGHGGR
jgi:hypothetical protein